MICIHHQSTSLMNKIVNELIDLLDQVISFHWSDLTARRLGSIPVAVHLFQDLDCDNEHLSWSSLTNVDDEDENAGNH
jgi:hypothetical protein